MTKNSEQILTLPPKEVMTIDELAAYTGYSKSYLYKLNTLRAIPHYKPNGGRRVYYKLSEINEWLCSQRIKTVAEIEATAVEHIPSKRHKICR